MVQLGKPLVELLVRHPLKEGEQYSRVERASINIQGASLGRLKPTRHTSAVKDAGGPAHNYLNHGIHGGTEDHPNFLPNIDVQYCD